MTFDRLAEYAERTFRTAAQDKGLDFAIDLAPDLPDTIYTDERRLEQVIGNLLANAFKFTEKGRVDLRIEVATAGWSPDREILNRADRVIAFVVTDTGIGIPEEKHKVIFEAFQQVEATTARRYGGVGLGLAISREIADLLSGDLRLVRSKPGEGSTFALYLPQRYVEPIGRPPVPAPAPPPGVEAAPRHPRPRSSPLPKRRSLRLRPAQPPTIAGRFCPAIG